MITFTVDRGGTFTDVYAIADQQVFTEKLLSEDPDHYPDAPREGIRRILARFNADTPLNPTTVNRNAPIAAQQITAIRMGTTVATNALLERKGTPCALVTTKGFRDLTRIGYQNRPDLFALNICRPQPLHTAVIEVNERVRPLGDTEPFNANTCVTGTSGTPFLVLQPPDLRQVRADLQTLQTQGIQSLAVVLIHGYDFTRHEQLIGQVAQELGFQQISLSHQVMPAIKMVARGDTTSVDAYLTPHINQYLAGFRQGFTHPPHRLHFMQSDGGLVRADQFKGANAILSGPAGGVVGYALSGVKALGQQPLIGFDMGGTSTDVSRYGGEFQLVHETETAGVRIQAPQLAIKTVAAGGGSRLFYRNNLFAIGPESAGAHPGPLCYRKNGHLSITDANLFLGRLHPAYFPKIFGLQGDQPLDQAPVRQALQTLQADINRTTALSLEEIALGFIDVANETMARPIREISVMRGHALTDHALVCFGGAGGQHACAIARKLAIKKIFIHRYAGILSAVGMGLAHLVTDQREPAGSRPLPAFLPEMADRFQNLQQRCLKNLQEEGCQTEQIQVVRYLNLRYQGTDSATMIQEPTDGNFKQSFSQYQQQTYGFDLKDRPILVDDIRIRATAAAEQPLIIPRPPTQPAQPLTHSRCYFSQGWQSTPIFDFDQLGAQQSITGPALIIQDSSTLLIEPHCTAQVVATGLIITLQESTPKKPLSQQVDPIQLAIFSSRFSSIAEQMGQTLQRTAISVNIKERLDFSCALFDAAGGLVANAPHVPVHLGAMSTAVKHQLKQHRNQLKPGDVIVSNHPTMGGSHLPDITVITPFFQDNKLCFLTASRGHHSDIGSTTPGSMPPFSRCLAEEGLAIKSLIIANQGHFNEQALRQVLATTHPPVRRVEALISDLKAQIAANQRGIQLLNTLVDQYGLPTVQAYMNHIQENGARAVRHCLRQLASQYATPPGNSSLTLQAIDQLDDGTSLQLRLDIDPDKGTAHFDFTGTGPESWGNLNTPPAVTTAAILYCLRCLIDLDIPLNQGCLSPVCLTLPTGSLLNPSEHAGVVGGNVLTSQRLVDLILRAVKGAAASQGCMNNLTFGNTQFGYYETIGGGSGAGPHWHGTSGVHTHMTNTRITDPEILEQQYPVMLCEFALRTGSGGKGRYQGGEGLIRELQFLTPLNVAILSERRVFAPYGMMGGEAGKRGENHFFTQDGRCLNLGGKNEIQAQTGDRIRILTPGGGGWGKAPSSS